MKQNIVLFFTKQNTAMAAARLCWPEVSSDFKKRFKSEKKKTIIKFQFVVIVGTRRDVKGVNKTINHV